MIRILILILITLSLFGHELKTTGNLELTTKFKDKGISNLLDFNINNDYFYDSGKLVTSLGVYITDNKVYNNNVKSKVNRSNVYRINELYLTQYLSKNLSISVGQFPFKKGTFHEHSYNGNKAGIGLYTLSDANLQGAIVTYKEGNHTFQAGSVSYISLFKGFVDTEVSNGSITFESYKDSGMDYLSYKYSRDKWYFEFMGTNTYQYLNDVKIMDTDTYSVALSYNDEIDTGRTYYSIFTKTFTDGDTTSLSPTRTPYQDSYYHFDKYETEGYSLLLGAKQELDNVIFDKDVVIGAEWLRRSEGYHSLLAGEPISYDSYSNIGDSYTLYTGIRINKNVVFKLRYMNYDNNGKMTKPILTTVPTDSKNGSSSGNYDFYSLQLYIEF